MNAAGSSHRMSRFVTGAMSEMLPKCSAVSGTVNTMAPTELAVVALKKARIFRRGRESFTSAGSRRASSARYSAPETQNRPAMDANESCRLILAAANGLAVSNMANAVSSDVGGSFSRPSSGAKSTAYDVVKAYADAKVGKFTSAEAVAGCPSAGRSSIFAALKKLTDEGYLTRLKSGRSVAYVRSQALSVGTIF